MHCRRITNHADNSSCDASDKIDSGKKNNLPSFMRSSKPAKRCSSPTNNGIGVEQVDPFRHLMNLNSTQHMISSDSNQKNDPHGAAYRQLGSLSGHRVCRQTVGTPNVAVFSHNPSRIAVLPPWETLVSSKRRGASKRKLQKKKPVGGPWKTVDEHVEQLRRKTACLNRSIEDHTNMTQATIKTEGYGHQTIKVEEIKPNLPHNSSSFGRLEWIDIKAAASSAHKVTSNHTETLVNSMQHSIDSEHEQGPAWKPTYVVGRLPETCTSTQIHNAQSWQDSLDKETIKNIIEASKPPSLRSSTLPYSTSESLSAHTTQRNEDTSRFTMVPESGGESSYQRVPGSESLDVNSLSSPWPNLWSPSPTQTNSTDKVHEE